jgi:hypothetical protein
MARYSAFKYGKDIKYGTSTDVAYSVAPFDVVTLNHNEVFLTWKEPLNPDSGTGRFARFRIVRNQTDVPETPEDGIILVDVATGFSAGQKYAIDGQGTGTKDVYYESDLSNTKSATYLNPSKPLLQGKITYYAAWIMTIDAATEARTWILVGVVDTLVAKDHSTILGNTDDTPATPNARRTRTRTTHEKVIDLLPRVFTSSTESPMDTAATGSDLDLFLQGFSYTLDELMTYTDLLMPNHTAENFSPQLLSTRSYDYNISPNNSDYTAAQRRLVREARYIASHRGTRLGAETAIEATVGYNAVLSDSPNILLSNQDSSFRGGVGNWQVLGNATITATRAVLPPQTTFAASAISNAGGTITYTCSNNLAAGEVVTITGATSAGYNLTNATVASASASQFTVTNAGTGSTSGALVTQVANSTDLASCLDFAYCAKVAVTAAGARIVNGLNNPVTQGTPITAGSTYTLSYYAKDDNSGTTTVSLLWYDYAGNLISTSVDTGRSFTAGWVKYSFNATAPATAVYAAIDIKFSAAANYYFDNFQLALSSVSPFNEARGVQILLSPKKTNFVKNPGFETNTTGWTATSSSLQTDSPYGLISGISTAKCMQATVNDSAKVISTSTSSGIASVSPGNHYTFSIYVKAATGTPTIKLALSAASSGLTTLTNEVSSTISTSWARYSVTLYIPTTYVSPTVTFTLSGPATDTVVKVDSAQLEDKYLASDYFDGSNPDCVWQTAHNSPSYYYPNKDLVLARLFMDIKNYLPINTPYIVKLDTDTDPIAMVNGTNIAGYTN